MRHKHSTIYQNKYPENKESQQTQVPVVEDFEFCFCLYLSETEKTQSEEKGKRKQREYVFFEKRCNRVTEGKIQYPSTWIFHIQHACTGILEATVTLVHPVSFCSYIPNKLLVTALVTDNRSPASFEITSIQYKDSE